MTKTHKAKAKEKEEKKEKKVALSQQEYDAVIKKSAERDEYFNKFLKSCADFDNFRKRFERERIEFIKFATEEILLKIIPIVDNLNRAVCSLDGNNAKDFASIMKGVQLIQAQFHDLLSVNGVKKIETKNQMFDPRLHEAVEIVEADDLPEHTVLEEIQPGYTLNGKVIKHVFVKVSKKKTQMNTDEKDTDEHRAQKE
ncbi:MAG: nucleotide exchange factor GrpE [Candidatus Omnitrophota bacterium]|nr:nucleotide exchange factor GrpE [Candidatus Omnitrophota bacterium]